MHWMGHIGGISYGVERSATPLAGCTCWRSHFGLLTRNLARNQSCCSRTALVIDVFIVLVIVPAIVIDCSGLPDFDYRSDAPQAPARLRSLLLASRFLSSRGRCAPLAAGLPFPVVPCLSICPVIGRSSDSFAPTLYRSRGVFAQDMALCAVF